VSTLTGIFFGGGDQRRVVESLFTKDNLGHRIETPLLTTMRLQFESGVTAFGGTSAGAACMSGPVMIRERSQHSNDRNQNLVLRIQLNNFKKLIESWIFDKLQSIPSRSVIWYHHA